MFVLSNHATIGNQFLSELRNINVQGNRRRFRQNLERLGMLLAYEISKTLPYQETNIPTPLGNASTALPTAQPVLIGIMRAGLPFMQGFQEIFDQADCGFIGANRAPHEGRDDVYVELGYAKVPLLEGRHVILADPMLATGKSIVKAINALARHGTPAHWHLASVVAAPEGLEYISQTLQAPHSIWSCAVDEKLDNRAYIVPGLGDAGDLAFGPKQEGV